MREENVPVLCAFEGVGVGVGDEPERRARLLWYDEGVREDGSARGSYETRWHDVIRGAHLARQSWLFSDRGAWCPRCQPSVCPWPSLSVQVMRRVSEAPLHRLRYQWPQ